jgi:hypothetical protein
LARQTFIASGNARVDFVTLVRVVGFMYEQGFDQLLCDVKEGAALEGSSAIRNLKTIYRIKCRRLDSLPITLQSCLMACCDFDATDPRDKIYSLLGMCTDTEDEALNPNYHLRVQEVYTHFTKYLMNRDHSLQILHTARIGLLRATSSIPSWVPDWVALRGRSNFYAVAESAGYRAASYTNMEINATSGVPQLKLRGLLIDSIKIICYQHPKEAFNSDPVLIKKTRENNLNWYAYTMMIARSLQPYPNGDNWRDAYWRTLIANVISREGLTTAAPQEYSNHFDSHLALKQLLVENRDQGSIIQGNVQGATAEMHHGSNLFNLAIADWRSYRLFITHRGYLGLGRPGILADDIICIIYGAATPFIIRRDLLNDDGDPQYLLVGECYIHGLMNGEGLMMGQAKDIVLI